VDPNIVGKEKMTGLMLAAINNRPEIVKTLLKANASLDK
jgi:ankyrin repeat protein